MPVSFVGPASTTTKLLNLRKHPASHAYQAISMRTGKGTKVKMPLTTIPLTIASPAAATHTATLAPPFATDVLPANKPLKMKPPKKPIACPARVDGTKYKRVKTSATIAAVENINLKTVRRFVCPATLDCINQKRGNRTARNARKTITPTNPNKPHAKRVWARKKRRFQVPPFVSNARRGNSCPPTKFVYFAN